MLVGSLREVIDKQVKEIELLQRQLKEQSSHPDEVISLTEGMYTVDSLSLGFRVTKAGG